jgi:hypothetical protein
VLLGALLLAPLAELAHLAGCGKAEVARLVGGCVSDLACDEPCDLLRKRAWACGAAVLLLRLLAAVLLLLLLLLTTLLRRLSTSAASQPTQ